MHMADAPILRKKILIVEDDKLLWNALYAKLTQSGYDATVCVDGQQAIDALTKDKYDLILLDLILPLKDGYAVLTEKAKGTNKETPVIVITNLRNPEHLSRARELGARDCYVKSQISLNVVIANIQSILGFQ